MPALFVGHRNPMNALSRNASTDGWSGIGRRLPRPKAILAVSAHWYISATAVTAMEAPPTIHDFGGFPDALYRVSYPASGDPALARRVQSLLAPAPVTPDRQRGLDHGAWAVLCHVLPKADVPVVQLSINGAREPAFHYELGKRLAPLRDEGVLVMGSGNLVHNLHAFAWGRRGAEPFDWALRFEERVRRFLQAGEDRPLIAYETLGPQAMLAVLTPDHYLPLLYVIALRRQGEAVSFPVEGVDGGSVSMLAVQIS
jgi:4,5-DOPA dioxygenase extradiol